MSGVEPGESRPGEPLPGEPLPAERGGRWRGGNRHRVPRLPVVVAVVALLVAGGLIDRRSETQTKPGGPVVRPMPAAAPLAAISSTWFCGGALGQPAKVADGQIVIANTLGRTLNGTVTFLASAGSTAGTSPAPTTGAAAPGDTAAPATGATPFAGESIPVTVGPRDRLVVPETASAKAAFVGASVELDGGGAAVQQVVTGAEGISSTACASTGSDHWYFADGTTEEHSNLYLTLADPYSEDAIVDLSFSTEQGQEAPADYQGIVISAGSVVGIDVGAHLRQRARVATTVAARAGRVAAFQTQVVTPAPADQAPAPSGGAATVTDASPPRPPGLSLLLGSPSPGTSWWWPQGAADNGVTERYRIYNPGDTPAAVVLTVPLDEGSADPFKLAVAPHSVATVTTSNESRIPKGVGHSAILTSSNGVGVVAERTVDAVAPSAALGLTDTLGSRLTSGSWLLPAGASDPNYVASVIVQNPGLHPARVAILGIQKGQNVPLEGLSGLAIPAGGRLVVVLNDHSSTFSEAVLVNATTDVVVERDETRTKGVGLDATMGVPAPAS